MDEKNPRHPVIDNPNHEFLYNGKLYFYNTTGKLLGTYSCKNPDGICDYATSTTDDNLYSLDYYPNTEAKIPIIHDRYAFLVDGENKNASPFLYDIIDSRIVISSYSSVKNYGIGIENDTFIVGNENLKYGVLSLKEEPYIPIKFDYDYIGTANILDEEENKLMGDFFAVYKDHFWYLLDANGATLTTAIKNEIVTYNGQNIIVKSDNGYDLIDYQDNIILQTGPFQKLSFTGRYLNVLEKDNTFYVYDIAASSMITTPQTIRLNDKITSRINDKGKLEVVLNEKVIETVEILN